MSTMKFECVHSDLQGRDGSTITMEIDGDSSLPDVLENFTIFLRGCGFTIEYDKYLDIVEDEV